MHYDEIKEKKSERLREVMSLVTFQKHINNKELSIIDIKDDEMISFLQDNLLFSIELASHYFINKIYGKKSGVFSNIFVKNKNIEIAFSVAKRLFNIVNVDEVISKKENIKLWLICVSDITEKGINILSSLDFAKLQSIISDLYLNSALPEHQDKNGIYEVVKDCCIKNKDNNDIFDAFMNKNYLNITAFTLEQCCAYPLITFIVNHSSKAIIVVSTDNKGIQNKTIYWN